MSQVAWPSSQNGVGCVMLGRMMLGTAQVGIYAWKLERSREASLGGLHSI